MRPRRISPSSRSARRKGSLLATTSVSTVGSSSCPSQARRSIIAASTATVGVSDGPHTVDSRRAPWAAASITSGPRGPGSARRTVVAPCRRATAPRRTLSTMAVRMEPRRGPRSRANRTMLRLLDIAAGTIRCSESAANGSGHGTPPYKPSCCPTCVGGGRIPRTSRSSRPKQNAPIHKIGALVVG